jgi:hypothetical protein
MITRADVIDRILAYLNGSLTEEAFIGWAEAAFVQLSESETDQPDEETLLDILGYIGAGDSPGFSLTWSMLSDCLKRLGAVVRVELAAEPS